MGQITKIDRRTSPLTRWCAPSLDEKLSGLLANYQGMASAPVIGPRTAGMLRDFLNAGTEPPLPNKDDVESMLALLSSVKRQRQTSEAEASAQLDLYWHGLRDVPLDDLRHAYDELLKSSPWFPDISEIRKAADNGPVKRHSIRKAVAQTLIDKHEREWSPPAEPCTPEQAAAVRAMVPTLTPGEAT